MSIFDKFNANPYIKTYAGAPINEALQVVKGLNARAEKNIAEMSKRELALANLNTIGEKDKQYKALKSAQLAKDLEGIMQAPEHATMKVRKIATDFAMDEKLRGIKATADKVAAFNAEYAKDPEKYGDVAAWELNEALKAYDAAGGAEGGAVFKAPPLTEFQDINKYLLDHGSKIAAMQDGVSFENGKFIDTQTREYVTPERVQAILEGALANNTQLTSQMRRQLRMENAMNPDNPRTMQDYLTQQVAPMIPTFSYQKETQKLSNVSKGDGASTGFTIGNGMFDYTGADIKFDMTEGEYLNAATFFDTLGNLENSDDPASLQQAMSMRMNYKNTVRDIAGRENFDPVVSEFLLNADRSDLPISRRVQTGMNKKMGTPIYEDQQDFRSFENYAKQRGYTPAQIDKYKTQIDRVLNKSILSADLRDSWTAANTLTMDTKFTNVAATLDLNERDTKRMNQMFSGSLTGKDMIRMVHPETGEVVDMAGDKFRGMYDATTVKIISADTNGTGAVNVSINDEDGNPQNIMIIADPQQDQVFRVMGDGFSYAANKAYAEGDQNGMFKAAAKGLSMQQSAIMQSAEMLNSDGVAAGEAVPINFGAFNQAVLSKLGNITMRINPNNGKYEAMRNGTNLFANSPEFTNLASDARSPKEMAILVTQYVRQNLAN